MHTEAPGRVFILAVDVMSFRPAGLERLLNETRQFVNALEPEDVIAIYPFPFEGVTTLTTDRSEVVLALERIVGTRDRFIADGGTYGLNPSDIVDLSTVTPTQRLDSERQHRVTDICASASDPEVCGRSVIAEARMLAQIEDGDVNQRLASFRALLKALSGSPHRKTVVLDQWRRDLRGPSRRQAGYRCGARDARRTGGGARERDDLRALCRHETHRAGIGRARHASAHERQSRA